MEDGTAIKRRINSDRVAEQPPGLWSNCFVIGNQFVLAGMVAWDKDKNLAGGNDPYKQSLQAFENMKALVEAAGGKMSDVLKINVYLTDMRHRPAFVEARKRYFSGDFPAAVVVGNVTLADPDLMVEIDAWGVVGAGGSA